MIRVYSGGLIMIDLEKKAYQLDYDDPLKSYRDLYELPTDKLYLCNNSLGLPVKASFALMQKHMQKWSELGAHGWFNGEDNWYLSLDKPLREPLSELLGAHFDEIVVMNSLTVNLHLLLISFYQPSASRFKILIDTPTFPSDLYAIKSHLKNHGVDPEQGLIELKPRTNEFLLRNEDIEEVLKTEGKNIAIVFLSTVNYLTGQILDIEKITKLAHEQGCLVGCDIAHAAGNIPLNLHNQEVDFAVGCSYKYLCSGPGGPGFAFVHSLHHNKDLRRLSGWWGNDPNNRFKMDTQNDFIPFGGANSWQVSTPSILAMLPLIASLQIYKLAGINNLRKKSELQTAFLSELLEKLEGNFSVITPIHPQERGCQISIKIHNHDASLFLQKLFQNNIICDFRSPDIIRITPSPLYNSFTEIYQFVLRFANIIKCK